MRTTQEKSVNKTANQRPAQAGQASILQAVSVLSQQQGNLSRRIAAGPVMTAQRNKIDRLTTAPIQKQSALEEEELMQGKFVVQHRGLEDEEELMQGAFASDPPRSVNTQPE